LFFIDVYFCLFNNNVNLLHRWGTGELFLLTCVWFYFINTFFGWVRRIRTHKILIPVGNLSEILAFDHTRGSTRSPIRTSKYYGNLKAPSAIPMCDSSVHRYGAVLASPKMNINSHKLNSNSDYIKLLIYKLRSTPPFFSL